MAQFNYVGDDCMLYSSSDYPTTTLILALIALEAERPGFLAHCVRAGALADAGWSITSRASNPDASLQAQRKFREWLDEFQDGLYEAESEL
jgi:hypothetical protein